MLETLVPRTLLPISALVLALGACGAEQPVTPLSQLRSSVTVETANDSPALDAAGFGAPTTVTFGGGSDAPRIADDATVTLDAVAMTAESRGGCLDGSWDEGEDCASIRFTLDRPAASAHSTIVIADSSATWTIEGDNLFANHYSITNTPAADGTMEITWADATSINFVYAQFVQNGTVEFAASTAESGWTNYALGNRIELPVPASVTGQGTLSLNASRAAAATRCDGPEQCALSVETGADLPVDIASPPKIGMPPSPLPGAN